jgi:hypothetical protein
MRRVARITAGSDRWTRSLGELAEYVRGQLEATVAPS